MLGGGVIGLTTAVVLAERGHPVRVWTREPARDTVSAVAGGLCWPYRIRPERTAARWAVASLRTFTGLAGDPARTGVRMATGVLVRPWMPEPWASCVDARRPGPGELPGGEDPDSAVRATTALIDMPSYLRYLRDRLTDAGGHHERRAVRSPAEAGTAAPAVVNCTGLGARELVPDPRVRPVQGRLVIVENPGVEEWYVAAEPGSPDSTYLLPQPYGLVLGGTAQDGAEDLGPDPAATEAIVRRCARIDPRVLGARVLGVRTGLRPFRPNVRLEREDLPGGAVCVHQYGHGGAGVTVSWASATAAADLLGASA